jgi:predicted phage terminase large subunit-like protein
LVNVPPATLKSTIASVLFPAWVWTWDQTADFLCFSYASDIGVGFSTVCRELLRTQWYQSLFPSVRIADDDDSKAYFRLSAGGWRRTSTIGGLATGSHPQFILIDDPISRDGVQSFQNRETLRQWYFETLSTRGIAKNAAHVVVQQRLHVEDLSGHILEHDRTLQRDHGSSPWHHICLPMRYDPESAMVDRGYGGDWRKEKGELLYPELLNEATVVTTERGLGLASSETQLGQRPSRRDGGLFKLGKLKTIDWSDVPSKLDAVVRFWDLASTEGGGCFTVGCLMGMLKEGFQERFYILDVWRGQWSGDQVIDQMIARGLADEMRYGKSVRLGFESQPAGAGKYVTEQMTKRLRMFRVFSARPSGSKEIRAEPLATSISYGEVSIVDGTWNSAFIAELESFPSGRYSDQVDAASGAFSALIDPTFAPKPKDLIVAEDTPADMERYREERQDAMDNCRANRIVGRSNRNWLNRW